jgi:hypothetical protein
VDWLWAAPDPRRHRLKVGDEWKPGKGGLGACCLRAYRLTDVTDAVARSSLDRNEQRWNSKAELLGRGLRSQRISDRPCPYSWGDVQRCDQPQRA